MQTPFFTAPPLCLDGIAHGFFGRAGGVSHGIYDSLNAGPGSGDAPEHVEANRARIREALKLQHLVSCHQVHSPDVVTVEAPWQTRPHADAMVTQHTGIGLCILSADCTPVLFADADARIIGAAHAGWKGALGGVLEATLARMVSLGARLENIHIAIGPVIRQASYEVGPEFRDAFLARVPDAHDLFLTGKADRLQFDLPGFCARQMQRAGARHIHDLARDTCADETHFFSNRRRYLRGEPDYGRNASVIALAR